jgi:hypothetical protein
MTTTINASNSGSGGLIQTADASGVLALQTAGTTALTLSTAQNATFAGTVTTNTVTSASSTALTLQSAGTTAVTIDTSQNVGIGTTSPSYRVDAVGAGAPANGIMRTSSNLTNSTTKYGYYTVGHYTNATVPFGLIQGESNSTENNVHIGGGAGEVTAATRIDFYTAANNTTTNGTERMRIDSSGNVLVGKTASSLSTSGFEASASGMSASNAGASCGDYNRNTNDGQVINFRRQGTGVGNISVTGSATAFNTSSDYRLKQNIAPMTGALAKVAALKPVTYKWKVDGSDGQGFIAHELDEVVPGCVTGAKDAVDANGNPEYQSIDTSFLVATLTAAIQEQQALITSLTARIAALEGTPA